MRTKIAAYIGATALAVAGLTGCSSTKTVDQSELENKTAEALQSSYNVKITVYCKGPLTVKTGEKQECALTDNDQWQLVTVTATNDDGQFNADAIPGVVPKPDWVSS